MSILNVPPPPVPSKLSNYLAAGVAVAAGCAVGTADGAIVYVDLNDQLVADTPGGNNFTFRALDINGDAVNDMSFFHGLLGNTTVPAGGRAHVGYAGYRSSAVPSNPVEVIGKTVGSFNYPTRLTSNVASIGFSAIFVPAAPPSPQFGRQELASGQGFANSEWTAGVDGVTPVTGIMGFRFDISGEDHYGWIRLKVNGNSNTAAARQITLIDAGYNSTPDEGIIAGQMPIPEPAGLGLLALGGVGLAARRRRQSA